MFRMSRASLLLNHSALALFAQRTRIPTSARSIGFCAIWICISSSSSSVFALVACICAFQKALSGVFPPNKSAGSECQMCFTSQVHKAFLRAIFAPVGHRLTVLVRRRAPATLSIACPLSCCIWPIMDYGSRRRMVRPESGRNSTQFSYSSRSLGLEIRRSRISEGIKRMFMGIFSC